MYIQSDDENEMLPVPDNMYTSFTEEENENQDIVPDLPLPDPKVILRAKEKDPMMFTSGFEADDEGIVPCNNPDYPGEKLLKAVEEGELELIKQLIETDKDLLAYKDNDGYTALHRACYENNFEIAKLLLSNGARVQACSDDGWTPLHSACHWNAFQCVRLLLESGADINAQSQGGQTPLHLASSKKNARETLIILLTEPGLNTELVNSVNETAETLSMRSGNLHHLFEINRKSTSSI